MDPLLSKIELSEEEIKNFRLCELFALLTLRQHYKRGEKNTINSSDYRANKDIVYATKFNADQDFVWFDVMAFYTNLPNVKRCYNRIDERLFAKAEGNKNSLYNSLLAYCTQSPHLQTPSHWEL